MVNISDSGSAMNVDTAKCMNKKKLRMPYPRQPSTCRDNDETMLTSVVPESTMSMPSVHLSYALEKWAAAETQPNKSNLTITNHISNHMF